VNFEGTKINDEVVVTTPLAPGTFPTPQKQYQGFFKVNHRFNDRNLFDARYSLNRNTQENQSIGGLNTFDQRSSTEAQTDAIIASLVWTISSSKVNEARFRYTYDVVDFFSPLTGAVGRSSRTSAFSIVPVSVVYSGV